MSKSVLTALAVVGLLALTACGESSDDSAMSPQAVKPGCEKLPIGLEARHKGVVDPEVWKQVSDTGKAWVVVVLADENAVAEDGEHKEPDQQAIEAMQQRLLHDLDVSDKERIFGGRNVAVISLEIGPGRARLLETLPYVCHVSSDRKLWPME
ncbi:MAG: hypothetical protein ACPG1C_11375 [Alphaproteobacteria bacterium]